MPFMIAALTRVCRTAVACARLVAAIATGLSSLVAFAQTPLSAPPPELFFKPPEVIEAKLSPSGRRLAVTSTLSGGERVGLFVWDLAPAGGGAGAAPRVNRAAQFTDVDVRSFHWVNDERLVFDVVDLSEGVQRYAPGLFAVRHDGEALRELIARQGRSFASSTRLGRESLSWNHALLAVPQNGGEEILVGQHQGAGGQLVAVRPLWLSTTSGRTRDAAAGAPANATGWHFDSRGEARVAVVVAERKRQVHWRGPGEDSWRLIDEGDGLQPRFSPAFVDDSGNLYVTRSEGRAALSVLTRWDFAANRAQATPFLRVPGFDFRGWPVIARGTGQGTLLGLQITGAETETAVWFDERLKRVQQAADERLPGYVNRLQCARCGEDDMVVLVYAYADRDPGHLWLYRSKPATLPDGRTEPAWQLISRVRMGVDPERMASVSFQRIAARDGREIPLWITLPPGRKPGDGGPAVVLVHGGPWLRGGHWQWSEMEQFLASRGYVVLSPEFRGSAGYGTAHLEAGFKQWGRAMQDDVADATRWAAAQKLADRFCIAGASYGGYSALMGLVRDADLYRCGVAWVAVTDPFLLLEGSWWIDDDTSSDSRRYTLPRRIGDAEKDAEMLKAASPVEQAAKIRTPLLLAYGERDRRVPLAHGDRLLKAMRAAGQQPLWVTYPDEGHVWIKQATKLDFARRVESFLEQHLKPAAK